MACGCSKNKENAVNTVISNSTVSQPKSRERIESEIIAVAEAMDINLEQCYLCAKKHIGRAQQFFEEYHNGYPDHVKNLVDSFFDAESDIYKAFQLWQKTQSQLDMSAGELLGNNIGGRTLKQDHVSLAAEIREERLKFDQNPLYVPNFDDLKYRIHRLQHLVLNEELSKND